MVSRLDVEGLGTELRRLYGALEAQLAAGVAERVAAGIDTPDWLDRKLGQAGEVRRWAEGLTRRINRTATTSSVRRAIETAFDRGADAAQQELAGPTRRKGTHVAELNREISGAQHIDRLASALAGRLEATQPRVVRAVVDAYREVVTAGAASVLGGAQTRREASQTAWNKLLDHGLTGFTDSRGRSWSLAGYVEMATRTATAQAAVAGQLDRAAELGVDLMIVSDAPQECSRCRPWEGKILTRDGSGTSGATLTVEHGLEDKMVKVKVAGSVQEALAAGLLHPNCRHSLSVYLPGLTTVPTNTEDPAGDKARQQLRELERKLRKAKLQEVGALTPEAKARSVAKQKELQGKIRQHVKDNKTLGIKRRSDREQIDLGNRRNQGPAPTPPPTPPPPRPRPAPTPAPTPGPAPPPPTPTPAPAPAPPAVPQPSVTRPPISMPDARSQRITEEEFDRHAAIAPRAMGTLRTIRTGSDAELRAVDPNAIAFYRIRNQEIVTNPDPYSVADVAAARHCVNVGWWVPCPDHMLGGRQTLAHELGHHIDIGNMRHWSQSEEYARVFHIVADELGVPRLPVTVIGKLHSFASGALSAFIQANKAALTRLVSEYGATDERELLAEIWAEYVNMGPKARPAIKRIGDQMRKTAEMIIP